MKVIASDAFGRDTHSDELILENLTPSEATSIAHWLSELEDHYAYKMYRAVSDSHNLYVARSTER